MHNSERRTLLGPFIEGLEILCDSKIVFGSGSQYVSSSYAAYGLGLLTCSSSELLLKLSFSTYSMSPSTSNQLDAIPLHILLHRTAQHRKT
jgi:hypothetical protein